MSWIRKQKKKPKSCDDVSLSFFFNMPFANATSVTCCEKKETYVKIPTTNTIIRFFMIANDKAEGF